MKCKKTCQIILLISGITMMSYGAVRGEAAVVLGKAIKIIHLKEKSFPSAERIAAFPIDNGIAPSKTP